MIRPGANSHKAKKGYLTLDTSSSNEKRLNRDGELAWLNDEKGDLL